MLQQPINSATATVQLLQINQYGAQWVPPLPTVPDDRSTNTAAVPQEENDGDGVWEWVLEWEWVWG